MQRFKNRYFITQTGQIACTGQTGWAGTNDSHFVTIAGGFFRRSLCVLIMPVCNKALQTADTDRIAFDASGAGAFTLGFLRTDTTADSGQRTIFTDDLISAFIILFFDLIDKAWNIDSNWAFGHTRCTFTI